MSNSDQNTEGGRGKGKYAVIAAVLLVVLCGGGLAVTGVIAAVAIPNFISMQSRAKRSEVSVNVSGIRMALQAYYAELDVYVSAPATPRDVTALTSELVSWQQGSPFDTLGWAPDGMVRGTYEIQLVGSDDFIVHGWSDVDGDGVPSHYTATKSIDTVMVTPDSVY